MANNELFEGREREEGRGGKGGYGQAWLEEFLRG